MLKPVATSDSRAVARSSLTRSTPRGLWRAARRLLLAALFTSLIPVVSSEVYGLSSDPGPQHDGAVPAMSGAVAMCFLCGFEPEQQQNPSTGETETVQTSAYMSVPNGFQQCTQGFAYWAPRGDGTYYWQSSCWIAYPCDGESCHLSVDLRWPAWMLIAGIA